MSDFTPSEEHLRLAYWNHIHDKGMNLDRRDIDAEFTRGIERIKAQVRAEAYDVLSRPIRADHESEEARGVIQRLAAALEAAEADLARGVANHIEREED